MRFVSVLPLLLSSFAAFAASNAPLKLTFPWNYTPKVCQTRLLAHPRSVYLRNAYAAQARRDGGTRAKRHVAESPALAAHWRLIEMFTEATWVDAIAGTRKIHRVAPGPIRISLTANLASGFEDSLWIDFTFASEVESREFYLRASKILSEDLARMNFTRNTPTKVFPWDSRTRSVLVLVGNDFDDLRPTDLETLDVIGEFNRRFVARVLEAHRR